MLTRSLLASACTLALVGVAAAADLPVTPPPVPVFTWTGVYLGGQIGYAWAKDNGNLWNYGPLGGTVVPAAFVSSATSPDGVIGGAHIGYNWQVNQWVLGLEGDVDGTSLRKTILPVSYVSSTTNLFVQGAILGRVGYAFDHLLLYATGGGTYGAIHNTYNVLNSLGQVGSFQTARSGWTVGGGLEYAVNNNWSVRAEYRYSNFGFFYDSPIVYFISESHHWTENQVKVGFSYKFTSAPSTAVAAKY
jgi:outer membrane immunogenic protein